jgi:hypothetical protein
MTLRPHRRNLVVWSRSAVPAGWYDAPRLTRPSRTRRIRRRIRIGALLTLVGLMRLAGAVRPRWRLLLAGAVLTVVGVLLRPGSGSLLLLPGLIFLMSAPLLPPSDKEASKRLSELERELAVYSTPAQRYDLEATLDRYPDDITHDLRNILARQAMAACDNRFPANRGY